MDDATRTRLARLAAPTRVHRDLSRDGKGPRDAAIYAEHCAGATLQEIADATGLAVSTVHRIVIAQTAEHQVVTVEGSG